MILMFSQHLLKEAMPLWQRNWMVSSSPSFTGTTGLVGRGSLMFGSLKSWLMAPPLNTAAGIGPAILHLKTKGVRVAPDPLYSVTALLLDQLHVRYFLQFPFVRVAVVLRVHEHLPVFVIDIVEVRAVIVPRITRLLTELDVLHVRLGGEDAVVVLPGAQQLVQVLGAHLEGVFLQQLELLLADFKHLGVGLIVGRHTRAILVH